MAIRTSFLVTLVGSLSSLWLFAATAPTFAGAEYSLLALFFSLQVPSLMQSLHLYLNPCGVRPLARDQRRFRSNVWGELYLLSRGRALILILLLITSAAWSPYEIGVSATVAPATCLSFGFLLSIVLILTERLYRPILEEFGRHDRERSISTLRNYLPRGTTAQLLRGFDCTVLSPTLEEIVYRGFFVLVLSNVASVFFAVITGWVLCVWLHLYQGVSRILSVTVFYAITIGLLFSPVGLLGAIGFHCGCNLEYIARVPELARRHWFPTRTTLHTSSHGRMIQTALVLLAVVVLLK